ncbi:MAG TPA: tetratricopeptide repeat-containing protein [Longimicrobiales bacterium]|nr:tetratricopeptide repeat-containing protein [Longimicrobiales bacterium]
MSTPPAPDQTHAQPAGSRTGTGLRELIRHTQSSAELHAIWRGRDEAQWAAEPELYLELAARFMGNGDGLLAHEVLVEARAALAEPDLRIEHQYGLVLARTGATERAAAVARALRPQLAVTRDGSAEADRMLAEVDGLLARTEKDLGLRAATVAERDRHLRQSFVEYSTGYERSGEYYLAINAATLALLLGDDAAMRQYAAHARAGATAELAQHASPWAEATLGEVALLHGDHDEAATRYAAAAHALSARLDHIASMRRQARLILEQRGAAVAWLDDVFAIPAVVAFAAASSLTVPDAAQEIPIERALRECMERVRAGFGFSAAAPGSETIFLELMVERGAKITIVLPCGRKQYERSYVAPAGDDWLPRYTRLLDAAHEIIEASPAAAMSRVTFEYAHLLLAGLAAMQSQFLDARLITLVHDETEQSSVTAQWRAQGHDVQLLDIR